MKMIHLTIDGCPVSAPEGTTILEAARQVHIKIPTLCYHEDQPAKANCRLCVVEINGNQQLQTACSTPIAEGMSVKTTSSRITRYRRDILELIFARHPHDCLSCQKSGRCELQDLAAQLGVQRHGNRYYYDVRKIPKDNSSPSISRDPTKCILCTRCIVACRDMQTCDCIAKETRGYNTNIVLPFGQKLVDTPCVNCGQCYQVCPTGAITIHDDSWKVYDAMDEGKTIVAQVAPSVRINLAECLGADPGTVSTGKIVTAMKRLGFHKVLDADFAADLTIMEEGTELLHRIRDGGVMPMITSCCPAWVKFCETYYPEQTDHLSTCKSPQQMFGPVIKTWCAEKMGLDPANICSVSIMPCTAKKFELAREEMNASGYRDVDVSITVQGLADMIRAAGIQFDDLEETPFDSPTGLGSGAGLIFGATGGVMEAALRTVYEVYTGETLPRLDFEEVRGMEGIKEATIDMKGTKIRVCIAHTLANARKVMEMVKAGTAPYDFIEIMACPGGCISGGGNAPRTWAKVQERAKAIYEEDRKLPIRKSHETPEIQQIYKEFLGEPCGEKAHELLHTHYCNRSDLVR
ncbi:MAG: NADH-dependent [FeFe] hydrogenase, group A6 [Oscillospiraceae bacterium]|nr:NADH-dependent [FeFe] hydrogenase, group A6 [Oscillospiraceae bacterium]